MLLRFNELVCAGEIADFAEPANLGSAYRARVTQIMNLQLLTPDIQEAILYVDRVTDGTRPFVVRQIQHVALMADRRRQRNTHKS